MQGSTKQAKTSSGRYKRSRRGCYTCRLRKKRCDERKPCCEACIRLDLPCDYPDDIPPNPLDINSDTTRKTNLGRKGENVSTSPKNRSPECPSSPGFYEKRASDFVNYDYAYDQLWDSSIPRMRGRSESAPNFQSDSASETTESATSMIIQSLNAFSTEGFNSLYSESDRYPQAGHHWDRYDSARTGDQTCIEASPKDESKIRHTSMDDIYSSPDSVLLGSHTNRSNSYPSTSTFPDHHRTSIAGGIDVYAPWRLNGEPQMLQSYFSLRRTKTFPDYDPELLRDSPEFNLDMLAEPTDAEKVYSDNSDTPVVLAHYDVQEGSHLQHLNPIDFS